MSAAAPALLVACLVMVVLSVWLPATAALWPLVRRVPPPC